MVIETFAFPRRPSLGNSQTTKVYAILQNLQESENEEFLGRKKRPTYRPDRVEIACILGTSQELAFFYEQIRRPRKKVIDRHTLE